MINAIILTFISGLSTLVGGFLSLPLKKKNIDTSIIMGFAAGVMLFVSLGELLSESSESVGYTNSIIAFFVGVIFIFLLDLLIPHEYGEEECLLPKQGFVKYLRSNRSMLLLTLGVALHNIPEGVAVFYSSLSTSRLGIVVALALIMHNIPEGLVIAMSAKKNSGNKYGLLLSAIAGFAEPIGAIITYVFLHRFINETILGYMIGAVAGIMCFISFDELLPKAYTTESSHKTILGIFLGIALMAVSLILLNNYS